MNNQHIHYTNTTPGFTLLELLFVIVILGVIATFGLTLFQQKTSRFKLEKAALQIQQIQQAAIAFYVDNNQWPANCDPNDADFASYLPIGITTNPWGISYQCQVSSSGKKFQIISSVDSKATQEQLTAVLPSASSIQENQVLSEIPIPAKLITQESGYLVQVITFSDFDPNAPAPTINFTCPRGWQGAAIALPNTLIAPDYFFYFPGLDACVGYGPGSVSLANLDISRNTCTPTQVSKAGATGYNCSFSAIYDGIMMAQQSVAFCSPSIRNLLGKNNANTGFDTSFALMGYCFPVANNANPSSAATPTPF